MYHKTQEQIESDLISRMDFDQYMKYNEYIMAQQKALWKKQLDQESQDFINQEELIQRLSTAELKEISQWIENHE